MINIIVASDIRMENIEVKDLRGGVFTISQCTRFSGAPGDGNCTNSQFQIRDVTLDGVSGTTKSRVVTSLQCSAVAPCANIEIRNVDVAFDNGTVADAYLCGNALDPVGFECTGTPCVGGSAIGECTQSL